MNYALQRRAEIMNALTDQWQSRRQLAVALGKVRLSQSHFEQLAILESIRQIEVNRQPDHRPGKYVCYYRKVQA
jgi:hypothetical protein